MRFFLIKILVLCGVVLSAPVFAHQADLNVLFEQNKPSVVKIYGKKNGKSLTQIRDLQDMFKRFFDAVPKRDFALPQSMFGSGIIMDSEGHIVTNYHVVSEADEIDVQIANGTSYPAELVGYDELTDVAVLKINAQQPLKPVVAGDSDKILVGDSVVAIGAPFGFDYSLTSGIVSAKKRSVGEGSRYVPFLQSDVPTNPGSSGGPLLDLEGKVVGMNTLIVAPVGGYAGLSFATPFNLVLSVFKQLKQKGYVLRAWLGVAVRDLSQDVRESLGIKEGGVLVVEVSPQSPAYKANILPGDIIIEFNGEKIRKTSDLPPKVAAVPVGASVYILVLQNNKKKKFKVRLEEMDNSVALRKQLPLKSNLNFDKLGFSVEPLENYSSNAQFGMVVKEVQPGSNADKSGLMRGDVLLYAIADYSAPHRRLDSADDLSQAVSDAMHKGYLAFNILRGNRRLFLTLQLK